MTLSIDADCALAYWMSSTAKVEECQRASSESLLERVVSRNLPDWAYSPDGRVHVLAACAQERIRRHGVCCQYMKAELPARSYLFANGSIPVVSPECCFLRLANLLEFPELVKAGMLLCSRFAFDDEHGLIGRRQPLTTSGDIGAYVRSVVNVSGVKKARRAVKYLTNNAASPAEINTCLLLSLPVMCGGYGCPLPELNGHVKLRADVARTLGYSDCYGDLLWRGAKCIVEYTSEQYHTGYQKQARDEMRRSALESMGYRVYLLTKPQLYNQVAFEGFVRPILRALGRRMPKMTQEYQQKQYGLQKSLLHEPSLIIRHACRM